MLLESKVIIVTGGNRGMGKEIALTCLKEGAKVAILDLDYDSMTAWTGGIDGLLPVQCDISKKEHVIAAKDKVLEAFGRVDGIVNNAGWMFGGRVPFEDYQEEYLRRTVEVNVLGTMFVIQVFGREMFARGGSIVNTGSTSAQLPVPFTGAYSSTKAAVLQLTKLVALEWGKYQIRCNSISPGQVRTDMNKLRFEQPGILEERESIVPLGRIGTCADIAKLICWLLSDDSAYISGDDIPIDGGMRLTAFNVLGK